MGIGCQTVTIPRRSGEQAFEFQLALAGFLTGYSGNTRLRRMSRISAQFALLGARTRILICLRCGGRISSCLPAGSSITAHSTCHDWS